MGLGESTSSTQSASKNLTKITIEVDQDPLLCGDIYFRLLHKGQFNPKLIARFALNTSFIEENYYEFSKNTVDPDSIIKDDRITWDFKIECYFKDFCSVCDPSMPLDQLCSKCTSYMKNEISSWKIIKNILDVRG